MRHRLEMRRARIEHFVNAVADAHDFLLLRERVFHPGIDLSQRADLLEHVDDAFIGAAVQRAFERADRGADGGIHVAQRRGDDAAR